MFKRSNMSQPASVCFAHVCLIYALPVPMLDRFLKIRTGSWDYFELIFGVFSVGPKAFVGEDPGGGSPPGKNARLWEKGVEWMSPL